MDSLEQERAARFCPRCAGPLEEKQLPSETRPRLVCTACNHILYLNPKVVVGAIPVAGDKAILLRRAIEPRKGAWTFPAGYVELGETVEAAALRETWEETNLEVEISSLLNVYSRPEVGIIVIVYLARIRGGEPQTGPETLEIASFLPEEVPWGELAFDSTRWALRDWARAQGLAPGGTGRPSALPQG